MRKEFIIQRQGRAFVLYAGLLAEAHSQGLQSIRTELLQVPSEENGGIAICRAVVTMAHEQREQVYTGIGDAAVTNVAPAMVHCLIRMAETRAKARALRDAVNVGVAAFEELGEEDAYDGAPERGYAVYATRGARADRSAATQGTAVRGRTSDTRLRSPADSDRMPQSDRREPHGGKEAMTEAQSEAIKALCRRHGLDPDAVARETAEAEGLDRLSQTQARDLIKSLNERAKQSRSGMAPAG